MDEETFIGHAIKEMVENEVTVQFNKRTNNSKHSANYFSVEKESKPTFIINYFDANLDFEIFLHEYCHFLQWKRNTKIWQRGLQSLDYFYKWLDGKHEICQKYHVINIQALELDADRRVVELIKKYKFDINQTQYIKESNSYILTFQYVWKKRNYKEFPTDYNNPEILELLPAKHFTKKGLSEDYSHIMELFEKCK